MLRAINIAATGMNSQESNVNTIANNIANVNTVGFKQGRTEFEDLLYQTSQEAGAKSGTDSQYNAGIQYGSGSKVAAIRKIHSQGNPINTNNPFDFMIQGEGFFGLVNPNGEVQYTRDGSFNVDSGGNIVTKSGQKLFPGLVIPQGTTSVNISNSGLVEAYIKNEIEPAQVGTIPVFTFMNPAGLRSEGGNTLSATNSSGPAVQNIPGENNSGTLQQGFLEASNVNVMNEMTNLIRAQRAYEMNSKVMGVADQMLQNTNNLR
jgi:flagellar basal-body rod protein FlgG